MDQIEYPNRLIWESRREWFEKQFDVESRGGGHILGEHAMGLLVDLQAIFCAGAFSSVLILSCTIIDANLREVELSDKFGGGLQSAFQNSKYTEELEWLRFLRNQLVHWRSRDTAPISVEQQWSQQSELERRATKAVQLVAAVLFENPLV